LHLHSVVGKGDYELNFKKTSIYLIILSIIIPVSVGFVYSLFSGFLVGMICIIGSALVLSLHDERKVAMH